MLHPVSAKLNDTLIVTSFLRYPDQQLVGFTSNERIGIQYLFNPIPLGKSRDFVFVCRGKYSQPDSAYIGKMESTANLPTELSLSQNYPNPFNPMTTIKYSLPKADHVTIEIYDLLGRKVETLVNKKEQAGYHQVIWNGDKVSSGLYFYRLQAGENSRANKMLLLK